MFVVFIYFFEDHVEIVRVLLYLFHFLREVSFLCFDSFVELRPVDEGTYRRLGQLELVLRILREQLIIIAIDWP